MALAIDYGPLKALRIAGTLLLLTNSSALAETSFQEVGRLTYAAWTCAALAALSEENREDGERLFLIGYENGKILVSRIYSSEVTQESLSELPIGLSLNLIGAPTQEFQLGYLWAIMHRDAYYDTWTQLDAASFEEMKELQIMKAETEFHRSNCALLK